MAGWGAALQIGAGVLGSMLGANAEKKAAEEATQAQLDMAKMGIESQEKMFDKSLELQQPYREAGYGALGGLQNMATGGGRQNMLNDYYQSGEFQAMQGQQEEQAMRNSLATGGGRGGVNQAVMGSIAPQLGMQYLQQQQGNMQGLANMGMGAASQGASSANQMGNNQANNYNQMGQINANNALTQGGINSNLYTGLAGLAYNQGGF